MAFAKLIINNLFIRLISLSKATILRMEPQNSTPKGQQRNIIMVDNCIAKDKTEYTIEHEMSDLAFQQFQGFDESLFGIPVTEMTLMAKELDKPISNFLKFGASIFGINTKHEFLLFKTSRFLITVDFYQGNRIRIRVGDVMKVLETETQKNRKNSQIVNTNQGLEWTKNFKQGQLFVKDVVYCVKDKQLQKGHNKLSHHGSHFSRKVWNDICEIVSHRK